MASQFPNEIWHKIFLYIDDPDFVFETLSLVCKEWYYLIRSLPEFCGYLRLDLPCEDLPSILKTWTGLTELKLIASPDDNDLNEQLTEAITQSQDLIQTATNLKELMIECYQPDDGYILDLPENMQRPHANFGLSSEEFIVKTEDVQSCKLKVVPTKLMVHNWSQAWERQPPNLENTTKLVIDDFSQVTALKVKCNEFESLEFIKMVVDEANELDYFEIYFRNVPLVPYLVEYVLQRHPKIDCISFNSTHENIQDEQEYSLNPLITLLFAHREACPPSLCFENMNFKHFMDLGLGITLPNVTYVSISGIFDLEPWKNLLKVFPNLENLRVQDESKSGMTYLTPVQSLLYLDLLPELKLFMIVYSQDRQCPNDCSDVVSVGQKTLHEDCEVRIIYSKGKHDLGYGGDCFMKSPWHEDIHIKHQGPNAIYCPNQRMH